MIDGKYRSTNVVMRKGDRKREREREREKRDDWIVSVSNKARENLVKVTSPRLPCLSLYALDVRIILRNYAQCTVRYRALVHAVKRFPTRIRNLDISAIARCKQHICWRNYEN